MANEDYRNELWHAAGALMRQLSELTDESERFRMAEFVLDSFASYAARREVERSTYKKLSHDLEIIVLDLAKAEPYDGEQGYCVLCDGENEHTATCPWHRAHYYQTALTGICLADCSPSRPDVVAGRDPASGQTEKSMLSKEEQIASLQSELAQCYRLSGADPDGNEDWRLALRAVAEVRRMREELEKAESELEKARRELARRGKE